MKIKKTYLYPTTIILFSIICGIFTKDYYLGTMTLMCGLLNGYYASIGKVCNYVFGILFCILNLYISYLNGLYGIFIFSLIIFVPSQIHGFVSWFKNRNKKNEVILRHFTFKISLILIISSLLGSIVLGYLLTKIPGQNLAFFDSTSTILNLCSIILMNLRYKEFWIVFLFNNVIDLIIWLINTINNTQNAIMMLIVSIGYMLINIYGLFNCLELEAKYEN